MSRINQWDSAASTIGKYYGTDSASDPASLKSLVPYHFVSALPTGGDIVSGMMYYLNTASGNYPTGIYQHDGSGWICVRQLSIPSLSWSSAVAETLVSGVVYNATITANLTSIAITIDANSGSCDIVMDNTGGFTVVNPTVGIKRGSDGMTDFTATGLIEVLVSKVSSNYIWSAIKTETL